MKKKVFEYVVVRHFENDSEIVLGPGVVLATTRDTAQMQVVRLIPDTHMDNVDDLDIVLRPFV